MRILLVLRSTKLKIKRFFLEAQPLESDKKYASLDVAVLYYLFLESHHQYE